MAINQNHLFEELNGIKCGIVEKNVSRERAEFLKKILEYNHYTVVIAATVRQNPFHRNLFRLWQQKLKQHRSK
jgi:hypothetical protein